MKNIQYFEGKTLLQADQEKEKVESKSSDHLAGGRMITKHQTNISLPLFAKTFNNNTTWPITLEINKSLLTNDPKCYSALSSSLPTTAQLLSSGENCPVISPFAQSSALPYALQLVQQQAQHLHSNATYYSLLKLCNMDVGFVLQYLKQGICYFILNYVFNIIILLK